MRSETARLPDLKLVAAADERRFVGQAERGAAADRQAGSGPPNPGAGSRSRRTAPSPDPRARANRAAATRSTHRFPRSAPCRRNRAPARPAPAGRTARRIRPRASAARNDAGAEMRPLASKRLTKCERKRSMRPPARATAIDSDSRRRATGAPPTARDGPQAGIHGLSWASMGVNETPAALGR